MQPRAFLGSDFEHTESFNIGRRSSISNDVIVQYFGIDSIKFRMKKRERYTIWVRVKKSKVKSISNISPTTASINQFTFTGMMMLISIQDNEGKKGPGVNVAGSESIRAQKCVRDKKWCHISRRQSSNSMTYG